jgi:glyoxylase-like metal-dependent hydrolase (beta-lactamase superfamily II)
MLGASAILAGAPQTAARPLTTPAASPIEVLPVQGNVYMIAGGGPNVAVQIGSDGVLLVDTPQAALVPAVTAAIRSLSGKPIRYIISTSMDAEHRDGTPSLIPPAGRGTGGAAFAALGLTRPAIVAHENVLNRLNPTGRTPLAPAVALPTTTYDQRAMDFSFNGEPVIIEHEPAAHTDGDSLVWFRRSDVLAVGDLFRLDQYPVVDVANGGTITGLIAALTRVIEITVPEHLQEGGTRVIPGHGRLCNEADVVEYRDMIAIVADRVRDMVRKGMTLDQVKAARPTRDYDTRYGPGDGFAEAAYRTLTRTDGSR